MTYPSNGNFGSTSGRGKSVCVGVGVGEGGSVIVVVGLGSRASVGNGNSVAVAVLAGNVIGAALGALVDVGNGWTLPQPVSPAHTTARVMDKNRRVTLLFMVFIPDPRILAVGISR
jgi:hypothetical protein